MMSKIIKSNRKDSNPKPLNYTKYTRVLIKIEMIMFKDRTLVILKEYIFDDVVNLSKSNSKDSNPISLKSWSNIKSIKVTGCLMSICM